MRPWDPRPPTPDSGERMRILVTGGAGFIGSHLTEELLSQGHSVAVIDDESSGRPDNVPRAAEYTKGDVVRPADLEPLFSPRPDAVCHIAGQVSLIRSFTDPRLDLRTNIEGTLNVLQLCVKHGVPRLLYASSMTVYGRTDALPAPETTPCQPVSYYGIAKYAAERYVHATGERPDLGFDFHVTSFRMYNVYGPRQALDNPYQGVLGIFLGNVVRGEPITIFGDGEQSRDFVYVSDVVRAWSAALANSCSYGSVFNLGSGRRLSINALADSVLEVTGHKRGHHAVQYQPERPGEQRHVAANISKARAVLGWEPRISFEEGLRRTLHWAVSARSAA